MAGFDFTVRTQDDLVAAVEEFGIVPLFRNSIPGFSVEEHVDPRAWFSGTEDGVWEWKGPVIRRSGCAYGKLFERKAAFVSPEVFRELANYRRDGYDFDARYDDGLASRQDKELFELLDAHAPVLSGTLKALGNYARAGRKGFDSSILRLQAQCYVLIGDFVYQQDRFGRPYGWGVAAYTTPEKLMGRTFTDRVYEKAPEESRALLLDRLRALCPDAGEAALKRFLG